ncbi:MAG: PQQ-dependent sugar dehydrogenase [Actinobacteria bacterium]|nr:PQQ-dependent sugar dehydrogenase [Actinomycetota bacterium]
MASRRQRRRTGRPSDRCARIAACLALALIALTVACGGGTYGGGATPTGTAGDATRPTDPPSRPSTGGDPDGALPPLGLELVEELEQPVFLTTAPGRTDPLYVVEKGGRVRVISDGGQLPAPFLDLSDSISDEGERGLLSIVFDSRFPEVDRVYAYSTAADGALTIDRFRVAADGLSVLPGSRQTLLSIPHPFTNHNGGQLAFGPDGLLYAGTGDGGSAGDPERDALDPDGLLGKLLTLDVEQSRPQPSVYALGLRNPWRFSFDRQTGDLWIGDVGQNAREEIDFLPAGTPPGANFGWPAYEGMLDFEPQGLGREGLVFPVFEYGRDQGGSVTGGYVYRGSAVRGLLGTYLFADFLSGRVWGMRGPQSTPEEIGLGIRVTSPVSFGEDGAGELYLLSFAGPVYRIVPR